MSNVRRGRQVERHLITLIRLLRRHGHCRHQFHGRINDPTDLALTPSVLRRHDFGQNVLLQEARDPRERAAGELEVIRRTLIVLPTSAFSARSAICVRCAIIAVTSRSSAGVRAATNRSWAAKKS